MQIIPVPIANVIRLASDAESGDPVADVGCLQTAVVAVPRGVPIAGVTRSRELGPASADHCPAAHRAEEALLQYYRPGDLRRPLSTVSGPARCTCGRQARDRHSLAPCWVQSLLALEVEASPGKTDGAARDPPIDPRDEPCQSAVGSSTDPWRTAQTRHRYRADECGQVYGAEERATVTGLADISTQPCRRYRRHGPVRGADDFFPASLWSSDPAA